MTDFLFAYYVLGLCLLSAFKAETLLLSLIVFVSHLKVSFFLIYLYVFIGSFLFNILAFIIGGYFHIKILEKFLSEVAYKRICNILNKYKLCFIILYRFTGGINLISPIILTQYVSFKEFAIFNLIGDILWSFLMISIGYYFFIYNINITGSVVTIIFLINFILSSFFCSIFYNLSKDS